MVFGRPVRVRLLVGEVFLIRTASERLMRRMARRRVVVVWGECILMVLLLRVVCLFVWGNLYGGRKTSLELRRQ